MDNELMYNKSLPIKAHYDTIVVGGGIAGVAAALAAKRNGSSVMLIEKTAMLGGLATTGLILYYLPLCDGLGRKVIGGISEELLHLSIKYGDNNLPEGWKMGSLRGPLQRYMTKFTFTAFIAALDELIESEGIDMLLETFVCDVITDCKKIKGVVAANQEGLSVYTADSFIDATGAAILFSKAGENIVSNNNYLSFWAQTIDLDSCQKAVDEGNIHKALKLESLLSNADGTNNRRKMTFPLDYKSMKASDSTNFILESRKSMLEEKDMLQEGKKVFITIPAMPQYRKIARITPEFLLDENHVNLRFDDSIGVVSDWRKAGPIYEIPYKSLYGGIDNLLAAGRCIGAANDAWEVTRCIPQAAATGQSAGVAAAMVSKEKISARELNVEKLQEALEKQGVIIHY